MPVANVIRQIGISERTNYGMGNNSDAGAGHLRYSFLTWRSTSMPDTCSTCLKTPST
jgi:hypothetical protein